MAIRRFGAGEKMEIMGEAREDGFITIRIPRATAKKAGIESSKNLLMTVFDNVIQITGKKYDFTFPVTGGDTEMFQPVEGK